MASIAPLVSAVPAPAPVTPPLRSGDLGALPQAAVFAAEVAELALPASLAQPAALPLPTTSPDEQAALRPDQVFLARQMAYPAPDGRSLASSWRTMVRSYGDHQARRELLERSGILAPLQLVAGQQGQAMTRTETGMPPHDAWRFTVHAGSPREHYLAVMAEPEDVPPGRRKHPRFALRLELTLADGTAIVVQVEPMPDGIALELCARDAAALARLRELQPDLEKAVALSGLRVVRWRFRDTLPPGKPHAAMAAQEAANALSLPVFRALAELALLLPLAPESDTPA